jgi:hypothetical protein
MSAHKASSNQQSLLVQNEARWGKERDMETYNLTEHNNNQHTIGTKTPPYANKARSDTRMPSAEPLVSAAARPGSSQNPCCRDCMTCIICT